MTVTKVAGVMLGLVGVGIVCLDQARLSGAWSLAGSLAVTGGATCVASAYVAVKKYGRACRSHDPDGGADGVGARAARVGGHRTRRQSDGFRVDDDRDRRAALLDHRRIRLWPCG